MGTPVRAQGGNLLWARRAGSGGSPSIPQDVGQAIAVDSAANAYVTGQFRNTATFGPTQPNQTILTAAGASQEIFVAKYDTNGFLQWAKRISTPEGQGNGIGVDSSGNVYVTGFFNLSGTFAPGEGNQLILTPFGVKDIFLAKYDTNGNFVWAKQAGSSFTDQAEALAVDAAGNSYVTGRFGDVATFGAGEANVTQLTAPGSAEDIFVAKYDSNGLLQWAKRAGGTGTDHGLGIAIDGSGNSYVTGTFSLTATFDGSPSVALTAPLGGSTDIFVAKYNTSGALQWAKRAGGLEHDRGIAIAVDSAGNPHVTGTFRSRAFFAPGEVNETFIDASATGEEVFLAKYNTSGALQWVIPGLHGFGEGIALDAAGNSYISGYTSADFFVERYGANGQLHWSTGAGAGSGSDRGFAVALDAARNVLVAGQFAATVIFGQGEAHQTTLISAGAADVFVAKFSNCYPGVDFDGDCKSDIAVYRDGLWIFSPSSGGANVATQFGGGSDVPMPGDYDGDGKTDIAVYRSGLWIFSPSSGGANVATQFGGGTDVPMPGDYDGDGKTDIAVYRNGLWIYAPSSGGANVAVQFGGGTDVPMPGDYDGDGKTDIAVYRSGLWIYQPSSGGANVGVFFGGGTDVPVPADYDGDGKTDFAVYRGGLWIYSPSSGGANVAVFFGGGTDVPVPADYDGDGKTDFAIYRNGLWVYKPSLGGADVAVFFGGGTDVPLN